MEEQKPQLCPQLSVPVCTSKKPTGVLCVVAAGKVELHGKRIEVEHSVPKKQR